NDRSGVDGDLHRRQRRIIEAAVGDLKYAGETRVAVDRRVVEVAVRVDDQAAPVQRAHVSAHRLHKRLRSGAHHDRRGVARRGDLPQLVEVIHHVQVAVGIADRGAARVDAGGERDRRAVAERTGSVLWNLENAAKSTRAGVRGLRGDEEVA